MTMQTMALVAAISAHLLAVAHVLDRVKWIYAWLPEKLRPWLLGLLAGLPPLAESLASARSGEAIALAVASGVTAFFVAYKGKTPPPSSGAGKPPVHVLLNPPAEQARVRNEIPDEPAEFRAWDWRVALGFALLLSLLTMQLPGCALGGVNWPKVAECAAPAEPAVLQSVASVLVGTGDVKSELENLAGTYAPAAIECAVHQIVGDMANGPTTARASRAAARGRAFLAAVQR